MRQTHTIYWPFDSTFLHIPLAWDFRNFIEEFISPMASPMLCAMTCGFEELFLKTVAFLAFQILHIPVHTIWINFQSFFLNISSSHSNTPPELGKRTPIREEKNTRFAKSQYRNRCSILSGCSKQRGRESSIWNYGPLTLL